MFACGKGLRPRDLAGEARGAGGQPARVAPSQQCVVGGNQGLHGPPHPPSPHLSPTWGAVDAGTIRSREPASLGESRPGRAGLAPGGNG